LSLGLLKFWICFREHGIRVGVGAKGRVTTKGCASGFKLDVESAILGEGGGICGGCCCCIAFGLIFRNLWFLNDSLPDPSIQIQNWRNRRTSAILPVQIRTMLLTCNGGGFQWLSLSVALVKDASLRSRCFVWEPLLLRRRWSVCVGIWSQSYLLSVAMKKRLILTPALLLSQPVLHDCLIVGIQLNICDDEYPIVLERCQK